MWRNPITEKQIRVLEDDWGIKEGEVIAGKARSITGWFRVLTVSSIRRCRLPSPLLTLYCSRSASTFIRRVDPSFKQS